MSGMKGFHVSASGAIQGHHGPLDKQFHRIVPWVTLFKNCSRNFDPSKNIALVSGGFLHYMDMKKFLKNLLRNRWSHFEIIPQECSLGDPFKFCLQNLICPETWLW